MSDTKFEQISESPAGAPPITFHFDGDVATAELVGAKLRVENEGRYGISMRVLDETGEVLADIVLRERVHRSATENVMDIGSALLWSHARWKAAQPPLVADCPTCCGPCEVTDPT